MGVGGRCVSHTGVLSSRTPTLTPHHVQAFSVSLRLESVGQDRGHSGQKQEGFRPRQGTENSKAREPKPIRFTIH